MKREKRKINLLIADDHTLFLQGISSILSAAGHIHIVGMATNGEEALDLMGNNKVDVLIADLSMPVMSGLDLIDKVKKDFSETKIIVVTMHNEKSIISTAMRKGVEGYLLKNVEKEELIKAIDEVMEGNEYVAEEVKEAVLEQLSSSENKKSANLIPELSEREMEILNHIAHEYTQEEIAEKLFISPHTVIFHRRKLLYKFNVKNTAGLIKKAMEIGLIK